MPMTGHCNGGITPKAAAKKTAKQCFFNFISFVPLEKT